MTKQQQAILSYFQSFPTLHPTAEEVYIYTKQKDSPIGIATVYRNLHKLVESGILRELNLEKQGVHYDLIDHEHDHFICTSCGHIDNIVLSSAPDYKEVQTLVNGTILSRQILFYGICKDCIQK